MGPINAAEFMNRVNSGEHLNLLDVREELEYLTYNIGGKNIPLSKLPVLLNELGYNKTDELIVICTVGKRSETARMLLNENGYVNARNLTGGMIALQKMKH
jgi:rhodanese-related sulfurtransferase